MTRPLVTVRELRAVEGPLVLLDVRYRLGSPDGSAPDGLAEYRAGHLPGAAYVDLDTDLAGPAGERGRHPLPDPAVFQQAMRRAGVDDDVPVVVYDDWSGHAAARAWWLLRYHGHQDVRVLDGGWPAWRAAGGAVATGEHTRPPGGFTARPGAMPVVEADEVLAVAERGVLVDARSPERYRGEVEPIDPVAGHIPGAVNVPTSENLQRDGRFREPAALRATYAEVGVQPGVEVAAYCGSGVTAAHDVLALELAGVRAALYPGSWSNWVADPRRPVATSGRP